MCLPVAAPPEHGIIDRVTEMMFYSCLHIISANKRSFFGVSMMPEKYIGHKLEIIYLSHEGKP